MLYIHCSRNSDHDMADIKDWRSLSDPNPEWEKVRLAS